MIVGQTSYMWYVVGDDVDVVYLASTKMPIPEFEQATTLAITVTGLTLVFVTTKSAGDPNEVICVCAHH